MRIQPLAQARPGRPGARAGPRPGPGAEYVLSEDYRRAMSRGPGASGADTGRMDYLNGLTRYDDRRHPDDHVGDKVPPEEIGMVLAVPRHGRHRALRRPQILERYA